MTPDELRAWITVGSILVQTGIATVAQVRALIQMFSKELLSEVDLNHILTVVRDDAARRQAIAQWDLDQATDSQ